MATGENAPAPVTRANLYPIFGSIYLLLAFCFLGQARHDMDQGGLYWIADWLFFAVAILWCTWFNISGYRERKRSSEKT
jgi:hypothetical protein